MPWSLLEIPLALPVFALVLFRLTGLVLAAPIYGSTTMPIRVRGALVLTVAAMIFPLVKHQAPAELTLATAVVAGVGELLIGLAIGLTLAIFMTGVEVGGLMVSQQGGIALSEVFDPTSNQESTTVGQIYSITLVFLFLLAGGHRATLAALLDTFQVIPLMHFQMNESVVLLLVEMLTSAFILGIRLAAPVLIALFLTALAMGFLSRTMPQLNILSVGFTVRVFVAIGVAALALGRCEGLLLDAVWDVFDGVRGSFGLDPARLRLVG